MPTAEPSGPVPQRPAPAAAIPAGAEAAGAEAAGATGRGLPFAFSGSTRDYFRIWAVNLCLTLLTLGIFSAWAKVRKKRYFYAHTRLEGTQFQYLGEPLLILKGRLIAVALFLLYYVSSRFVTGLLPYVVALGLILAPWVVSRSAAFTARYSAWRNLRFAFGGNYLGAAWALYGWGVVPFLAVGTAFDFWGSAPLAGITLFVFGVHFPWWLARVKRYMVRHSAYGERRGEIDLRGGSLFRIYFFGGLIMGAVGGLLGLTIGRVSDPTLLLLPILIAYAGYVAGFAYIRSRSANLVWNASRLGPIRFRSTLNPGELALLYLVNALAIVFSLGLATPWAVIRTMKYRADHMQVSIEGDLAEFTSDRPFAVAAAGAEVAEIFDLDLSL